MHLLVLLCLFPQGGISDTRDERIKDFLNKNDVEALELSLWSNPNRTISFNDIMLVFKKQYNLDIAVNYGAFAGNKKEIDLNQRVKRIISKNKYIPRGLALQLYLDNFKSDLTFAVDGGTIWIVPGKGTLTDHCKTCELGQILKATKPKYDTELNKEGTNRVQIPPTDLIGALQFFSSEDRGNFALFVRDRNLPLSALQTQVKIPKYTDLSYDAILKNLLGQANCTYIVNSNSVVVVPLAK